MLGRKVRWAVLTGSLLIAVAALASAAEMTVDGGPMDVGFNSGTFADIHATVHGIAGQPKRYAVFAEIQYYGTTASAGLELDRQPEIRSGVEEFQAGWPIPPQAPTGLYTVTLRVEDRIEHSLGVTKKVRGFIVYRKPVRISRVTLDQTIYTVGEPIKCEVGLENLSDADLKGLRIEFSNANYPWIAPFAAGGKENPELAVRTFRDHLDIAPGSAITVPMAVGGTAAFLRGQQRAMMGSGIGPSSEKVASPEVDMYTVALWNADRTKLYDMQFTSPAIIRTDSDVPKPYSRNFTHPYNSYIDFAKYREFYAPGQISSSIRLESMRTLYRPGDTVRVMATLKDPESESLSDCALFAHLTDKAGKEVYSGTPLTGINLTPGAPKKVTADTWAIPSGQHAGTYYLTLELTRGHERLEVAETTTEIAVNTLPASLLVICPHEDDEQAYGGLIRAAVEAGIPVQVATLTGGDVGECERYFDKPCGPNEAHEFATVRMAETADALGHLGVSKDRFVDMGLPDGGLGAIWFHHRESADPFLSIYLACDHAPFASAYKPNLPYARDAVLEAVRQIISNFHPAMIALPHPDERHVDHRTACWLAIKACQELLKTKGIDPQTEIVVDQAYGSGGFKAAPYKYESYVVHLSGEAAALKQEMAWLYQSQDGNLDEGAIKPLAELPRDEQHLRVLDWAEHEGWNETE